MRAEQPHRCQHGGVVHDDPRAFRQLPATVGTDVRADARREHPVGDPGAAVAQHSSGGDHEVDLAQVDTGALDEPPRRADDHRAATGVAAQREPAGSAGDRLVVLDVDVGDGQVRRVARAHRRRGDEPRVGAERGGLHGARRRPAHAEVALDRAGLRRRGDDVAGQPGGLGIEVDHGVHVGRRTADVDDDHVPRCRGEHLDPGQDDVGRRSAHDRAEGGATVTRAERLAADDVAEEHLADGGASAGWVQHPDLRQHVRGEHVRRGDEERADLLGDVGVPGDHDRSAPGGSGQDARGTQEDLGVAAVGATGQQHDVRP